MTSESSVFSAASANVGYLFQARLALALCLRYAYGEGNVEVAVERFDDVSFTENGTAFELLQTKHHMRRAGDLGDSSADLWKTLRIWSEAALGDPGLPNRLRLTLITTSVASNGSIAGMLRPNHSGGIISGEAARAAAIALTEIAQTSKNQALRPAFEALLSLSIPMRASLLSAVQVLDNQPTADDLSAYIEDRIRMMAPRGQSGKAREMLEGWWWPRIITALVQNPVGSISILEVETKLDEIRESLQRNALSTDFEFADPPTEELQSYEVQGFVQQLRAVGIGGNRIELAKRDYYRAFSQRSEWVREHVVLDGEITRFETTLIEEWQPRFAAMCERHAETGGNAKELQEAGQEIYHWVETGARFPFRTLIKRFLNVGSYHILANAFRLGWHRDYASHQDERP